MPADLLFEIGCEEIPAKMLAKQLAELPALVETRLAAARLDHHGVRALGTPRRLAVLVKQLADRQPDLAEQVVGPPVSAAFAPDGSVTKAGQGFAAKNGVDPTTLVKQEVAGKKGLYVVAVRSVVGQDTRAVLPALLGELAASLPWPKSQRWGWSETVFVRPVQWLVALFGGEVVPLTWAGLTAGRASRGHRFLSHGAIEIGSPERYIAALRAAHVVVDPDARRDLVRAELARLEHETGLRVRPDEPLLAEVIHLGEYPVGVCGGFDPAFLEVPEEMIVTAMRTHQRYFAMEDAAGKLAPRFATMMATIVKDPVVVQKGNERVIASRLSDAKFFFAEDRKKGFAVWNTKLESVVFQAKLGDGAKTVGDKVRRIEAIVDVLAPQAGVDAAVARTAARNCKADLVSSAVGEFPELQGVMGRHYAHHFGLGEAVAAAIDEHWWPKGQGGAVPATPLGTLLALADRMDTVIGCFAVGLEPTGSADPFGLRRAAIGIWSIMLARGADALWQPLFDAARAALAAQGVVLADAKLAAVEDFFAARLRGILVEEGIPAQEADAALAQGWKHAVDARERALACMKIPKEAREVFKRIANILDDARAKHCEISSAAPQAGLFQPVEARLWDAFSRQLGATAPRYPELIQALVTIQPEVSAFFDKGGVMVMYPYPALRTNRLTLLNAIYERFVRVADFRKLGATA